MERRTFLKQTGTISAGLALSKLTFAKGNIKNDFPVVRIPQGQRNFTSPAIEKAIASFKAKVADKELGWLFENCFPNTLDTTVFYSEQVGIPDTYVITGDIDAMWLRDSSAQVYPYLAFMKEDAALQKLIAGVIHKQAHFILKDPYANAFYNDDNKVSEWKHTDLTVMKPGIHERKWEIDSLCYPIRLAYAYWKQTGDTSPFNTTWKEAIVTTLRVFKEQQRKKDKGSYTFQRTTAWATDGVPMAGYGYPVKPSGLICSMFRPSDDATVFAYLIPSNFFAEVSLRQAAEMVSKIFGDANLSTELYGLAKEIATALLNYATIAGPLGKPQYAYEINGYGSALFMDDANVPSLLSLPYLGAQINAVTYANTRNFVWSKSNPFYFSGTAGEGIGGPHVGLDYVWPMSITMRALTSNSDTEIKQCISMLKRSHADTGFMHESFHKDDVSKFTRKWFAWANTLFGELLWKTYLRKPSLLQ